MHRYDWFAASQSPRVKRAHAVQNEIQAASYVLKHDPAVVAGFFLIGISSMLYFHVELKMVRAGYKTSFDVIRGPLSAKGLKTPSQYLKIRTKHGWSPWPIYLGVPFLLTGIGLLVFGLFRL